MVRGQYSNVPGPPGGGRLWAAVRGGSEGLRVLEGEDLTGTSDVGDCNVPPEHTHSQGLSTEARTQVAGQFDRVEGGKPVRWTALGTGVSHPDPSRMAVAGDQTSWKCAPIIPLGLNHWDIRGQVLCLVFPPLLSPEA